MLKASRLLGWLILTALVAVTLCPIGFRPVSHAPVSVERFGAFALMGFLFALGYPRWRLQVIVLTVAAAGLLEILQTIQPTRHGRMPDFLLKAAGCAFGALAAGTLRPRPEAPGSAPTRP